MDEQRKLRNLLAYTKMDSVEELEDCNKLYEELLAYINKVEKITELLGLYRLEKELKEKYHTSGSLYIMQHVLDEIRDVAEEIYLKEKELGEMK